MPAFLLVSRVEEIDLESVKNNTNTRMTEMIRNIPNRYSVDDLRAVLDGYVASSCAVLR